MKSPQPVLDGKAWSLLVFLSMLWGCSFFFVAVALRELPPLTIVMARVTLAALLMLSIAWWLGARLPRSAAAWWPFIIMGILNNVVPHSFIAVGQTQISSGLASILNATTPLFSVVVMAIAREERMTAGRLFGLLIGIAGVALMRGSSEGTSAGLLGVGLCLAAAASYAFAGLWGRLRLQASAPLASATGQLIASSVVMIFLAAVFERPWLLPVPSFATFAALTGFAALSTALAYIVFFEILARAGATNVMLVTLLIPVTAILLGVAFLGETIGLREVGGAGLIAAALLVVDGRIIAGLRIRAATRTR